MNQLTRNRLLGQRIQFLQEKKESGYRFVDWLSFFLFSIFYMALWHAPGIPLPPLSLFLMLALGGGAFVLQRKTLNNSGIKFFWIVTLLSFLGALISLLRAPHFSEAAWNTVGYVGNVIGFFLFLPILSLRRTRLLIILLHIFIAILWGFKIQELVDTYGVIRYWTFGFTGSNKNHIGICLALASVASLYLSLFYRPAFLSKTKQLISRIFFGGTGLFLLFNLSLIYARSSMLSAVLGILIILFLLYKKNQNASTGLFKLLIALALLSVVVIVALPRILSISTSWEGMVNPTETTKEGNTFDDRATILKKGFYLLGKNPILGVGIGGGRHKITDEETGQFYRTSLMHNSYLADWVDKGILGLLADIIWVVTFIRFVQPRYLKLHDIDRIWIILCTMAFFSMLFKDLSSIGLTMFTLLAAIIYSRKKEEKEFLKSFLLTRRLQ